METSPLPVKGCKFWPMLGTHGHWACSEGSFACHTYCDMVHPFIMVISADPWHSHLLPSVKQWAVDYCFYDLHVGLSRLGFEHPTFRLRGLLAFTVNGTSVVCYRLSYKWFGSFLSIVVLHYEDIYIDVHWHTKINDILLNQRNSARELCDSEVYQPLDRYTSFIKNVL